MNIMMMTNTYTPIMGGLERSIQAFTAQFRKKKHKVTIVVPEYEEQPKKEKGVVRIPAIQKFNGTDFSLHLPIPGILSNLMEVFKPDVVHAHHPFLLGDMALRLSGQYHIPLVFSYHTMFEQYVHYLPLQGEVAKTFITELAAGYGNLADRVIAPSESVQDILLERGVESPIDVVPTGVDIKRFEEGDGAKIRKSLRIPAGVFVAGHVGRLAQEKNLKFLCSAMALFLRQNREAFFLVVGKGPLEEPIRRIFEKEGVWERVRMPGPYEGRRLVQAYHAMDVFVFASKSETQGLVLTEAMSAGVPVVALDASGVREVLKDLENGCLLEEEDAGRFAQAVSWIVNLPASGRQRLKEGARRTARDFSIGRTSDKALEVYEKAIAGKRRERHGHSRWHVIMGRIKTEWDMFANLGKAAGAAVAEAVK